MLFTGSDNHEVGLGNMVELLTPEQKGQPGYEGYLNSRAITVSQRLSSAGYYCVLSGKWHLGLQESQSPAAWGFDRSFAMVRGEANHFVYEGRDPSPDGFDLYRLDGKEYVPEPGYYSSDMYTDYLLDFLRQRPHSKPFFAALTFTAPHSPLQAPASDIRKYRGAFDNGPSELAARRLKRIEELGLFDDLNVRPHPIVDADEWDRLTADGKAEWACRMEVYAAMIDRMDHNIGRVMRFLHDSGETDNTVVIFLSDNGAAGDPRETNPKWGPWITKNFDNSLSSMGSGHSYLSTGRAWAQASMSPFALFKGFTTEGGTASPTLVAGPGVAERAVSGQFGDVRDLVPTILDLAGVPTTTPEGKAPLRGRSLAAEWRHPHPDRDGPRQVEVMELKGCTSVRKGDWKAIVITSKAAGTMSASLPVGRWLLYNMAADPGETHDVAANYPHIVDRLKRAYSRWAKDVGVVDITTNQLTD